MARGGPGNEMQGSGLRGSLAWPGHLVGNVVGLLPCQGARGGASLPFVRSWLSRRQLLLGKLWGTSAWKGDSPLNPCSWRKLDSWEGQRVQAAGLDGGRGAKALAGRALGAHLPSPPL